MLQTMRASELLQGLEIGRVDIAARLKPATMQVIVPLLLLFPIPLVGNGNRMYRVM